MSRTMRASTLGLGLSLSLLGAAAGSAQQWSATRSADSGAPAIVRCRRDAIATCLRLTLTLPATNARLTAGAGRDSVDWSAHFDARPLLSPHVEAVPDTTHLLHLLVLVDVSGSMNGKRMELARAELDAFVRALPRVGLRVAVVPFSAERVAERIGSAQFTDVPGAVLQLRTLPAPRGNTGLYSAIEAGSQLLAGQVGAAGPASRGVLLVVTDGENSVGHPSDDRGLLDGVVGRERAAAAVRRFGIRLFAVGLGTESNDEELRAMSGDRNAVFNIEQDEPAFRAALADVAASLNTTRVVTIPLSSVDRARLARAAGTVSVAYRLPGGPWKDATVRPWQPSLLAPPSASGVATVAAGAYAATLLGVDDSLIERPWVVAYALAGLLVLLWVALTRIVWRSDELVGATGEPGEVTRGERDVAHQTLVPSASNGARRNGTKPHSALRGAPTGSSQTPVRAVPRRPSDITADGDGPEATRATPPTRQIR